jgi:ubiquinone/menaquinone biosynthesis C-methylase UbiE
MRLEILTIRGGLINLEVFMDYRKIKYDEFADIYSKYRNANKRVISNIIANTNEAGIVNALEIGCGTADYLFVLKQMLNFDGYGFDRSEEMLKEAAVKNPGLTVTTGNANDIFPYDSSKFDLAFSINVIHYIDNLEQYFKEAYRTLNNNGLMLTVTASVDKMKENINRYFPEFELDNNKSEDLIERIVQVMKDVGFEEVYITKSDYEYKMTNEDLIPFENKAYAWLKLLSDNGFNNGIELMRKDILKGSCIGSENFTYIWGRK